MYKKIKHSDLKWDQTIIVKIHAYLTLYNNNNKKYKKTQILQNKKRNQMPISRPEARENWLQQIKQSQQTWNLHTKNQQ